MHDILVTCVFYFHSQLGFHLMPNNPKDEWKPVCHAELILTQ